MIPLRHHGVRGFVEVEPRPGGHAYVRWFRYPLGELRVDGLPKGDYQWSAALEMNGTTLSAFLAHGMPTMDEFRDILDAARMLGAETLSFEHREITHTFNLSKQTKNQNNTMPEDYKLSVGEVTLTGPNGVEFQFKGLEISRLDSAEAGVMASSLGEILASWLKFNPITGSPQ